MPEVVPPQEAKLSDLLALCNLLKDVEETLAATEAKVEELKNRRTHLAEKLIPDLMNGIGLTELNLVGGKKIKLKDDYFASVSKDRMQQALAWLQEHRMDGIAKVQLVVPSDMKETLLREEVPFNETASIHPSTLKAFVKEQLTGEHADQFPRELFGASVVRRAVVV